MENVTAIQDSFGLSFDKLASTLTNMNDKIQELEERIEKSEKQQVLNRKQARDFIGVSNPTFQRYINDGLPTHGTPKKQLFFLEELLAYIKDQT